MFQLPIRRTRQGRYQSTYPQLQQEAGRLTASPPPAPTSNSNSAVGTANPTRDPVFIGSREHETVRATCTLLGGDDYRTGRFNERDACVLKFLTSLEHGKYKLDRASVELYFSEHGPTDEIANSDLVILREPSPIKPIRGPPRYELVSQRGMLSPGFQFGTGGGQLGEYERTFQTEYVRYWEYTSMRREDRHGGLTMVKLSWRADAGDPEVSHVGPLYCGVVVGHAGRDFWVGCRVELQLSIPWLKRFTARSASNNDGYTFRSIPVHPTSTSLRTVVDGLDEEISLLMSSHGHPSINQ
ncbi:hypothetical protein BJY04DRAFT_196346 [Aspergillus karnatakaensis]|uniref:uncharacterized protein n=1 Tax=Aspergillus karnatakaensis TaxID=1810916 RepID=UPI003CCDF1A5